jgi:hypothetical protein
MKPDSGLDLKLLETINKGILIRLQKIYAEMKIAGVCLVKIFFTIIIIVNESQFPLIFFVQWTFIAIVNSLLFILHHK